MSGRVVRWVGACGIRWVVDADRLPSLQGVAAALADSGLRPVHEISSRAHFKVPLHGCGDPGAFVKQYRLLGWARRLRHLVRPLPAAVEWRVARALAPHGLAAVVPWAWGVRRRCGIPVECYLVADDLGDLETLQEWIPRHRRAGHAFRSALGNLARTLRRLHGLGYFHGDPHQQNIIPVKDGDGVRWAFLDFQQARRARLTAPYRRLRDLGRVFHGVRLDLGLFQRAHLLRAYLGAEAPFPRRLFRFLEALTQYYEFRLLRRRARRCLTVTEHFRLARVGPLTMRYAAGVDPKQIANAVAEVGARGSTRKSVGAEREGAVEDPGPIQEETGFMVRAVGAVARRAWIGAHALLARGVPTARPLAWVADERDNGEYLLTAPESQAAPLEAALEGAGSPTEEVAILRAAGAALRRLHDTGGRQRGTLPGMLAGRTGGAHTAEWAVLFSRPEDMIFRPWVGDAQRRRAVARLAAAVGAAVPAIPDGPWRAFLQAYLPPTTPPARREAFRRIIQRNAGRIAVPAS